MSVSLRPVYRAGRVPARPPLTLAFAALVGAVALTGLDVAHQLRTGTCISTAPVARSVPVAATVKAPAPATPVAAPARQVAEVRATAAHPAPHTPRLMAPAS